MPTSALTDILAAATPAALRAAPGPRLAPPLAGGAGDLAGRFSGEGESETAAPRDGELAGRGSADGSSRLVVPAEGQPDELVTTAGPWRAPAELAEGMLPTVLVEIVPLPPGPVTAVGVEAARRFPLAARMSAAHAVCSSCDSGMSVAAPAPALASRRAPLCPCQHPARPPEQAIAPRWSSSAASGSPAHLWCPLR